MTEALLAIQLDHCVPGDPVEVLMVVDDRCGEVLVLQRCRRAESSGSIGGNALQILVDGLQSLAGEGTARCV